MAATAHTPRKDIIKEGFQLEAYDSRLQWAFPPTSHSNSQQGGLVVCTAGETGAWLCLRITCMETNDNMPFTSYDFASQPRQHTVGALGPDGTCLLLVFARMTAEDNMRSCTGYGWLQVLAGSPLINVATL
jgi:hypothetical protein